jgi:hypothetical protein
MSKEYKRVMTQMTVYAAGKSINDESATVITIDDEGGGAFIDIKQWRVMGTGIQFDLAEWPAIKAAIETMIAIAGAINGSE